MTVAVCFASSSGTLAETLVSIASQQDAPPFELLLVSNATTDDSVSVARRYSEGLPVRIVECVSVGYDANARNVAMVEAAADCILFVDADDTVDARYVVSMAAALEHAPLVSAVWELTRLNAGLVPAGATTVLPFNQQGWTYAPAGTLGLRREVPQRIGGFDPALQYAANNEWCFRAFAAGYAIQAAEGAVVHYRLRGSAPAVLRQRYRWAVWEVAANAAATRHGLPARGLLRALGLGTWYGLLVAALRLRGRGDWLHLVGLVGRAAGRLVGTLRFRRLDL